MDTNFPPVTEVTDSQAQLDTHQLVIHYELIIERQVGGFEEVGNALKEIRDRKLFQPRYPKFNDYLKERWDMTSRYGNYQIKATEIMCRLRAENFSSLPTRETHIRELTRLPDQKLVQVWQEVLNESGGKVTAAAIKEVVQRHQGTAPVDKDEYSIVKSLFCLENATVAKLRSCLLKKENDSKLFLTDRINKLIEKLKALEVDTASDAAAQS
jgi:hypothetical protein